MELHLQFLSEYQQRLTSSFPLCPDFVCLVDLADQREARVRSQAAPALQQSHKC